MATPSRDDPTPATGLEPIVAALRGPGGLERALSLLEQVLDDSPLAMGVALDGALVRANARLAALLGHADPATLLGERLVVHALAADAHERRRSTRHEAVRLARIDGSSAWANLTTSATTIAGTLVEVIQAEPVTARWEAQPVGGSPSPLDGPTGLVDRQHLIDALGRDLAAGRNRRVTLLLIDADRIGSVNASLGLLEGDRMLGILAERLQAATRAGELVSRLGGDQFGVLLHGPRSKQEAAVSAERLLARLREPVALDGGPLVGSVSIGVATSHARSTVASLLSEADMALRRAKAEGRNRCVVVDEAFRAATARRSRLEGDLRMALGAGELELHYQPELDLVTGRVLGVEALVRWPHRSLGLLPADEFVPVAEDVGLVAELGRWALRRACEAAARWSPSDPGLTIGVNVSAAQLRRVSLVADVRAALDATGVDPAQLCLEITETAMMSDVEESMQVLADLHDLGVVLAIDDFGTGFSSLAHLRRFPVSVLKIDRSFVAAMDTEDGRAIVAAVLQLAGSLDMEVIAEGIETTAQHDALVELGCHRGQGHLFSAARPEADLLRWLANPDPPPRADGGAATATG